MREVLRRARPSGARSTRRFRHKIRRGATASESGACACDHRIPRLPARAAERPSNPCRDAGRRPAPAWRRRVPRPTQPRPRLAGRQGAVWRPLPMRSWRRRAASRWTDSSHRSAEFRRSSPCISKSNRRRNPREKRGRCRYSRWRERSLQARRARAGSARQFQRCRDIRHRR